jgi:hypothetical protein
VLCRKKIETKPPENMTSGATDDEEEWLTEEERRSLSQSAEDQRKTLRKRGYDNDQIEEIVGMSQGQARDYLRRAKGRDQLPINRTQGGRGGHFGGERSGQHASGESDAKEAMEYARQIETGSERRAVDHSGEEDPNNKYIIDHGLDARRPRGRDRQAIDEARRLMRRFGPEAGCAPERHRGTSDPLPSEAQRAELHRLVPGLALVGDVWGDGPGLASHKNPYEI